MLKYKILATVLVLARGLAERNCLLPTIRLPFGNCSFLTPNKKYVHSTGILIGVGPSDSVCGMTSTVVNSTLIQSSDVCSNKWLTLASGSTRVKMTAAQCRSRRGGFINRDDVPAASSDALSTLSNLNPGWVNITKEDTDTPFQYAVETDLRMQDQSVTMLQGLISEGQQHTMSHIGLAETSTLLQSLKDAKLIRAKSWGLDAGSQSFTAPRNGSLVLGGYDASSIGEGWFSYEIPKSNLVRERSCPLQVQITQMELDVQVGQNKIPVERPVTGGSPLAACIEP
ncbi:hypothetical protein Focb16_v004398 [Fusarium oxysporum f. sp. cubense]|uniref:Peptidase A1 domain-containing protein n=1 Tax=Fusarium oxysporum f. sp. cubense TaxID=61366 RepID=A0A559LL13_FUSOC|nr:hypothetical protein Focb16_v004398 [Fusarium oxysporum f. sp. cubense]